MLQSLISNDNTKNGISDINSNAWEINNKKKSVVVLCKKRFEVGTRWSCCQKPEGGSGVFRRSERTWKERKEGRKEGATVR